jgi:hypothetical protein
MAGVVRSHPCGGVRSNRFLAKGIVIRPRSGRQVAKQGIQTIAEVARRGHSHFSASIDRTGPMGVEATTR